MTQITLGCRLAKSRLATTGVADTRTRVALTSHRNSVLDMAYTRMAGPGMTTVLVARVQGMVGRCTRHACSEMDGITHPPYLGFQQESHSSHVMVHKSHQQCLNCWQQNQTILPSFKGYMRKGTYGQGLVQGLSKTRQDMEPHLRR